VRIHSPAAGAPPDITPMSETQGDFSPQTVTLFALALIVNHQDWSSLRTPMLRPSEIHITTFLDEGKWPTGSAVSATGPRSRAGRRALRTARRYTRAAYGLR